MRKLIVLISVLLQFACKNDQAQKRDSQLAEEVVTESAVIETPEKQTPYEAAVAHPHKEFKGMTVAGRFSPPEGYKRMPADDKSFASYLRTLPLKTPGTAVMTFDGKKKSNNVHEAVIDLKIGDKDLHQCADAIIRLKAEHHWLQKEYDKISFIFTNGYRVEFNKWLEGKRMIIEGNKSYWDKTYTETPDTYESFWSYLELIFTYAGTKSLWSEMRSQPLPKMQIGDAFIKPGSPGHAVLVVDLIENETGDKKFMLAQSYMPAQEIHILKNPNSSDSPWYSLNEGERLVTPEWTFTSKDLRRFNK